MKILHKSILKELAITFLLSLAVLNFILMMEKLLRLSKLLSGIGTSMFDMVRIIIYLQPQMFLITIPMALLLATLVVYGRLNLDNELVIMRTSGMNFFAVSKPVLMLGSACFLINIGVSFYMGPQSALVLRDELRDIIRGRAAQAIEEGRFSTVFKDAVVFVHDKPDDRSMRGIFLYDNRDKKEAKVLVAREGTISTQEELNLAFLLRDGQISMVKGNRTTEIFFKKYSLILSLDAEPLAKRNAELTPFELADKIGTVDRRRALLAYNELHRRLSLPLLCLLIVFLGPSLSLMAGKAGKLGGLTLGLAIYSMFYMMLLYGENLVRAEKLPHYVGAWLPSTVLIIFGLVAYRRESSR
ncbi:MAG: LptF/LptG family permease [Nitrospirota bacterium]